MYENFIPTLNVGTRVPTLDVSSKTDIQCAIAPARPSSESKNQAERRFMHKNEIKNEATAAHESKPGAQICCGAPQAHSPMGGLDFLGYFLHQGKK